MFLNEDSDMRLVTDKLYSQYTQKIPEILYKNLSCLTPEEKKRLGDRILVTLAKAVHDHHFNPNDYLTTGEE
jgi:hypothetical protein